VTLLYFNSIRSKLLSIVAVTILTSLFFAFIGNIAGDIWAFRRNLVTDTTEKSKLLVHLATTHLKEHASQRATDDLKSLAVRPSVLAAAIYDADGKLFASYVAPHEVGQFPTQPGLDQANFADGALTVVTHVLDHGQPLGTMYMRMANDATETVVEDIGISMVAIIVALFVAFLLITRLEKIVTAPISAVATAARDVVEQRDYSRRVLKQSEDEAGMMVESFNGMLAEIERRTAELEASNLEATREAEQRKHAQQEVMRLNEGLETRVHERTAELEELNRELALATEAAQAASLAKSNFLATMSHEIRTPMNGVIGMVDVLHQTSLNGYQVEMVDLIRDSGFSLLTIIDDILDFSKIEAGRLEIESTPICITDMVEKACGMLGHLADKKGVELRLFIDPLMPLAVLGDGLRVRQVLVNLVSNAIKFSSGAQRPGRVAVRVSAVAREDGLWQIEFTVSDNGIGMDEATQARLFTAFTQGDATTTRRFGGTGLGLVISRYLADLMGGTLELASVPGTGSTFTVCLPFTATDAATLVRSSVADIAGLSVLVAGGADGLADDIAAYLERSVGQLERVAGLTSALALSATPKSVPWIWIVDAPTVEGALAEWRRHARSMPAQQIRIVSIGRGTRMTPHAKDMDLVQVDGNVLTLQRLFQAVAIAAGRMPDEVQVQVQVQEHGADDAVFKLPSHIDAIRDGRLILVAEDNETNQKVIVRQLALLGLAADVAENGRQAIGMWRAGHYALLLTDLHMPEMDGYELSQHIRDEEQGSCRIPILALTANTLKGEAQRCRDAGMDDYLSKPLQLKDLQISMEKWLPASPTGPQPAHDPALASVVDANVLRKLIGDDPASIREIFDDFRFSAVQIVSKMRTAVLESRLLHASDQAHKLKSSSRAVGAPDRADLMTDLMPRFEHEFDAVIAFLMANQRQYADRRQAD
jgi:signal transduction histidine kinase/DNA-binding response OmpR family regulator